MTKLILRWETILDDSGGPRVITSVLERVRRVILRAGERLEDARLLAWRGRQGPKSRSTGGLQKELVLPRP